MLIIYSQERYKSEHSPVAWDPNWEDKTKKKQDRLWHSEKLKSKQPAVSVAAPLEKLIVPPNVDLHKGQFLWALENHDPEALTDYGLLLDLQDGNGGLCAIISKHGRSFLFELRMIEDEMEISSISGHILERVGFSGSMKVKQVIALIYSKIKKYAEMVP